MHWNSITIKTKKINAFTAIVIGISVNVLPIEKKKKLFKFNNIKRTKTEAVLACKIHVSDVHTYPLTR